MEQILEFTYQPQQTDFDAQLKPLYRDKQISSVDRIRLWKRLPLGLATALGPSIVRYLP